MFGELVQHSSEWGEKSQDKKHDINQVYKTIYTAFSLLRHIYCNSMWCDGKSWVHSVSPLTNRDVMCQKKIQVCLLFKMRRQLWSISDSNNKILCIYYPICFLMCNLREEYKKRSVLCDQCQAGASCDKWAFHHIQSSWRSGFNQPPKVVSQYSPLHSPRML